MSQSCGPSHTESLGGFTWFITPFGGGELMNDKIGTKEVSLTVAVPDSDYCSRSGQPDCENLDLGELGPYCVLFQEYLVCNAKHEIAKTPECLALKPLLNVSDGWITDRQPREDELTKESHGRCFAYLRRKFLVTTDEGIVTGGHFRLFSDREESVWEPWLEAGKVIAWQPMPAAYKEGD